MKSGFLARNTRLVTLVSDKMARNSEKQLGQLNRLYNERIQKGEEHAIFFKISSVMINKLERKQDRIRRGGSCTTAPPIISEPQIILHIAPL